MIWPSRISPFLSHSILPIVHQAPAVFCSWETAIPFHPLQMLFPSLKYSFLCSLWLSLVHHSDFSLHVKLHRKKVWLFIRRDFPHRVISFTELCSLQNRISNLDKILKICFSEIFMKNKTRLLSCPSSPKTCKRKINPHTDLVSSFLPVCEVGAKKVTITNDIFPSN